MSEVQKLATLQGDLKNANKGTKRGREMVKASLAQYGAGRSILIDKHGRIIAGNKTAEAAEQAGLEEVVIVQTDGRQLVAVQRTDLDLESDPDARALAVADNRAGEIGLEWDPKTLADLVEEIDLSAFFAGDEINALLASVGREQKGGLLPDADPDALPSEAPTRCQPGDLWRLGDHRLLCGDSTKAGDVNRLLGGAVPLLMVTDPPYGVEYDPNWRNEAADKGLIAHAGRRVGQVANDDRMDWTEAWALFPGEVAYCWHAGRHASEVQRSLEATGFEMRCQIVWAKSRFAISRGHYHWQHEPCWYAVRKGKTAHWVGDRSQTTLWQINLDKNVEGGHSTQKPCECMSRPLANHEGDVYDPFLGSGTTLMAAQQLGRTCYGMEIEPRYCDVILSRFEQATGLRAVRIDGPTE